MYMNSADEAKKLEKELISYGSRTYCRNCDVRNIKEVEEFLEAGGENASYIK